MDNKANYAFLVFLSSLVCVQYNLGTEECSHTLITLLLVLEKRLLILYHSICIYEVIFFHTRPPQYITAKFGNDDFDDTETNFG